MQVICLFILEKRTKAIEKKPVECVIKLLNIPLVL